jgi:hypothetical protein
MVFDAPGMKRAPFEERYKKLEEIMAKVHYPQIKLLKHRIC